MHEVLGLDLDSIDHAFTPTSGAAWRRVQPGRIPNCTKQTGVGSFRSTRTCPKWQFRQLLAILSARRASMKIA